MKFVDHKQELKILSPIWFLCEPHCRPYTCQNYNQFYSKHWTTCACQLIHKNLKYRFWVHGDFEAGMV